MAYIEFRNVHKSFGNNEVLKGINLSIDEGEFVTLLGPSGCGKSTLLRCFSGLETVTEGEIYLDGTNITDFTPKQRKIGMVFQQYSLFPNMTVRQNVAFGLQMQKKDKHFIAEKVKDVLGEFTTSFTTSSTDRAINVGNGAKKINGSLLYPGDTLSVNVDPLTVNV